MKKMQEKSCMLMKVLVAGLLFHSLAVPVLSTLTSFDNQNTYYSPDPQSPTGHHGGSPPHKSKPPPPTSNCEIPPHVPTPSRPSYNPSPPPRSGGGTTPTSPVIVRPPATPSIIIPGTPPLVPTPPFVPTTPPFIPIDPNTPFPAPANYWSTNPTIVWGLVGWWCTLGTAFGVPSFPSLGNNINVVQALSNTNPHGLGALYREGTASLLNSMVSRSFPFTTKQVRGNFISALSSSQGLQTCQSRIAQAYNPTSPIATLVLTLSFMKLQAISLSTSSCF